MILVFLPVARKKNFAPDSNFHFLLDVQEPVMSLAVKPKKTTMQNQFGKALNKFSKEDPTLRVKVDPETKETILSGMGELHLEVYIERMNREYGVECITGQPNVNYKETINKKLKFDWVHKSRPVVLVNMPE